MKGVMLAASDQSQLCVSSLAEEQLMLQMK